MKTPVPIFIADDHQLVRKGFRSLLEELDWVEVAGEASNGKEVLAFLRSRAFTGVVLLDCEMPEMDGLQTLEVIRQEFFGVKTIMLTMLQDKALIQKAVDLGVNGFLFKNASLDEMEMALREVSAGGRYFASDVALTLLKPAHAPGQELLAALSEREVEVLKLVAQGLSSSEIGKLLFISPRTVDTHRNNLIQKLKVQGIAGLIHFAVRHKLI
ncbi:MAG: response regulator transcription factor [Haliscomenobacter sp.]|nr:response regulator transcription factor [Haliscomenobacter sp.]MBK8656475.1 response regulator transcription factor [Haliscomenobacter sp.]